MRYLYRVRAYTGEKKKNFPYYFTKIKKKMGKQICGNLSEKLFFHKNYDYMPLFAFYINFFIVG